MIIRFEVENFLSFNKKQSFSLVPSNLKNKKDHIFNLNGIKLLSLSAIYGGNASGKTNFIKAIDFFQEIVLNKVSSDLEYSYFREKTDNINKFSKFEIEFIKNNSIYAYGIQILCSQHKLISEWLYKLNPEDDTEERIYEREYDNDSYHVHMNEEIITGEDLKRLEFVNNDMKTNEQTLLLNEMNRNKEIEKDNALYFFKEIYDWFENDLKIYFPDDPITSFDYVIKGDNKENEEFNKLVSSFDTGISSVILKKIKADEYGTRIPKKLIENIVNGMRKKEIASKRGKLVSTVLRNNQEFFQISNVSSTDYDLETIKMYHGNDISYDFRDESDGTRRLFDLLDILLTKSNNKVFIVDELDRSLHPNLTYQFIELFFEIAKKKNIQLIFTTHESKIMDLELVRQDEIWFVERNKNNESELFSLDVFKERYDKRIEKAYLEGRYGAIPVFSSFDTFDAQESEV